MNFAQIIEGHPPTADALVSRGQTTSYGALNEQVGRLRGALSELGVGTDDRVALLCGNSPYFVVSYLACLGLGAVVVPLNPTSPALELQRELQVVGARAVVVEPTATSAWQEIDRTAIPLLTIVIATDGHEIEGALTLSRLLDHPPIPITSVDLERCRLWGVAAIPHLWTQCRSWVHIVYRSQCRVSRTL